jgi:hypothetical protein
VSGQHENAGADNVADAERHQGESRETALERHAVVRGELLEFGLFGLRLEAGNRFSDKIIGHRDAGGERTTIEGKLSFTRRFRIADLSPRPRCCRHALSLRKRTIGHAGYRVAVFFT